MFQQSNCNYVELSIYQLSDDGVKMYSTIYYLVLKSQEVDYENRQ